MNQQVNLFQPIFRRERRLFGLAAMVQCLLLASLGLLGIHGYQQWQLHALTEEVANLDRQREAAVNRLAGLQKDLPAKMPSATLADEVARLTRSVRQREDLIKTLSVRLDTSQNGLARFLEGLARQQVEGLWLTRVLVAEGGEDIVINGRALDPGLIPMLVQRLSAEASFAGVKFRELKMLRGEDDAGHIQFELRTTSEAGSS